MRQVTHALLTRPPLSHKKLHSEKIRFKCFVRLACVKHAASVHPEPGSNSHKNVFLSETHARLLSQLAKLRKHSIRKLLKLVSSKLTGFKLGVFGAWQVARAILHEFLKETHFYESLILAQDERWRRA